MPFRATHLKRWLQSPQARLLVLPVLLVLVFVWGSNWVAGKYLYERQKEFLQVQQSSAATVYAEVLSKKVDERIRTMASLATHIDSQRLHDEKYVQQYLAERYVLPLQFPAGSFVLDRNGMVVADLPQLPGRKGSNYADRLYFQQAKATGRVVVSSPIKGRFLNQTLVAFAAPLLDKEGQFAGALLGAIEITSADFLGLLSSASAMGNNEFYLVDASEKITIASSDPSRVMVPLINNRFAEHLQHGDALFVAEGRTGVEKIYAVAPVENTDWKLVIALPTQIAFASIQAPLKALNAMSLVGTLVGLLLTGLIGRRMVARLEQQNEALESTVRQRTQQLQDLYDQAPCGYHSIDAQGIISQVNQTELQYLGYAREEFVGKPIYDFLTPHSAARVRSVYPKFLDTGDLHDLEVEFVCKNGSTRPFRISANVVRDAQGQALFTRSTLTDDSERQLQVQKMQELYQFLQDVVEQLPFGLLVFDDKHRIVLHNSLLSTLLALPADFFTQGEVFHTTLLGFKHQRGDFDDVALSEVVQAYTERLDGRQPVKFQRHLANGRWFEVQGQPLLTDHMVVTYTDITRQREIEQEIRASKTLAEAATLAKSQFLANMSHEIRTPMNGILGLAYVLEKMPLPDVARGLVHRIAQTGRMLQSILNDILDFSKIEANQMTLEHASFTLEDVLESVSSIMLGDPLRPEVELAIAPPMEPVPALLGDGLRLGQVLINLMGNAIKFTPRGFVRLSVNLQDRTDSAITLQFSVKDTGIGMAPEVMEDIFKAFNQADASTTRRYGGTGLGLSISRRLVELMGGRLEASSAVGLGSEFHFTLTLPRASLGQAQPHALQHLDLVIADDSEVAREALRHTALYLGWNPTTVDGGQAAVDHVLQRRDDGYVPQLLLVDWKMPDLDGLGVAQTVHDALADERGPIVILATAYSREALLALPESRYVDAVLNKPVSASALLDAVASAMRRRGQLVDLAALAPTHRLTGMRLLVVDDSDVNLEVARLIFEGEGAQVFMASDGLQAIQWLDRHPDQADAVLMDAQMPVMNGIDAARTIHADARFASLPIVALSAGAFAKNREEALAAGMADFIAKPMDVERAVAVLQALVPTTTEPTQALAAGETAADSGPPDYPGLDLQKALQLWRDEDKYKLFLRRFIDEYSGQLAAQETLTLEQRAALIHKLAGAAGSLALPEVALAARAYGECRRAGGDLLAAQQELDRQIAQAWGSAQRYLAHGADPVALAVIAPDSSVVHGKPASAHSMLLRPILVVDDEPANLAVMGEILSGEYPVVFAATGREALDAAKKYKPSMVLLDVQLPDISGHEVCRQLMQDPHSRDTIVLFVTSMSARAEEEYGFELGAVDYIVKPISPSIVRARVKAHLSLVRLDRLQQSYSEAISMLGEAAHFNDEDTGVHIWRMAAYSRALAQASGQHADFCALLEPAASMHDTGKIGIPESILKKPGPLDAGEWKVVRTHSQLGHDILSRGTSEMFVMAASIALAHHEKWDGSGYPKGLRGEEIPIEARLVAIADVFDALTARRPYKEPWTAEQAFAYVREARGLHFDPALVDVFLGMKDEIERIQQFWAAHENGLLEAAATT